MYEWDDYARKVQEWVIGHVQKTLEAAGINASTIDASTLRGEIGSGVLLPPHATEHEAGGADEIDIGFLAGTINDAQHGSRAGGTTHAVATALTNGFMSAAHFTRVNAVTAFIDTLLNDADAATARATLELVAGAAGDIWVEKAGDTMSGDLAISKASALLTVLATSGEAFLRIASSASNANMNFDSPAGSQSQLNLRSGTSLRWVLRKNSTAEGGSDAGSDFELRAYDDTGTIIGNVINCVRASRRVGIAQSSAAAVTHQLDVNGDFRVVLSDAATAGISEVVRLGHNSSGTPAVGYGLRLLLQLKSSTTSSQDAAAIDAIWSTATHATRTSYISLKTVTSAGALAEVARFDKGAGAGTTGFMIWDVDNGTLERVTVGAAGSGGTGFKVLRIPD